MNHTPSVTVYDYESDSDYAADGVTLRAGGEPAYSVSEALGQPVRVTVFEGDPANNQILSAVHYRYDARGRLVKTIDASNNATDTAYNDAGQVTEVLEPQVGEGRVRTAYTYAYIGGPLIKTDLYSEDGTLFREVVYERGPEGELIGVKHLMVPSMNYEYEATYAYDAQYRVARVTDGRGYPTDYVYDAVGNLREVHLASSIGTTESAPSITWTYDDDHNLVSRLDGKGILTEYVLDAEDSHLTHVKYGGVTRFHFDYDIYGRLTGTDDYSGQTGQLGYTYDDNDLPQTATTTYPGLSAVTLTYAHYPDGSRKSMVTPAGTYNYAYAYNTTCHGLRIQTQPPWGSSSLSTRCFYNASGQVVQQSHGRLATSYVYDARGFLTALRNVVDGSVYTSEFTGMLYDAAGNRTYATVSIPAIGLASDRSGSVSYGYDAKDRLRSEQRTLDSGGDLYNNSYTPDAADNLLDIAGLSFTFNPKNYSSAGVFDDNGNATSYSPVSGRSFGLGYDAENQPVSVTGGLHSITMAYRADGLRAWREVGGSKTYFLYDGNDLVSELDSLGKRTCSYVFGPNGLAQARRYASPLYEDYIYDPQGSLIQFDREGELENASRFTDVYDAYGRLWWSQSVTGSQTFAHPANVGYIAQWGVYTDWETTPSGDKSPLPLMGVRYYDPYTGRFLARDPIGDGVNWYSYANGNPVRYIDPTGESAWDSFKAGAAWLLGLPERAAVAAVRGVGRIVSRSTKMDPKKSISADIRRAKAARDLTGDPDADRELARWHGAGGRSAQTYYETTTWAAGVTVLAVATNINWGAQGKHIIGKGYASGRSIVTVPETRIASLIQDFAGKGVPNTKAFKFGQAGYREIVDFGEPIGLVWDRAGKRWISTNKATLHYSNNGVHMVPKW